MDSNANQSKPLDYQAKHTDQTVPQQHNLQGDSAMRGADIGDRTKLSDNLGRAGDHNDKGLNSQQQDFGRGDQQQHNFGSRRDQDLQGQQQIGDQGIQQRDADFRQDRPQQL